MGVRDSQFNLAVLYARGLGVEQDLRQSWMWFSLAAAQGDSEAARKRDEVAARMDPGALTAAADQLAKFKAVEPDPTANDVAGIPGDFGKKPLRRRPRLARPGLGIVAPTGPAAGGGRPYRPRAGFEPFQDVVRFFRADCARGPGPAWTFCPAARPAMS